MPRFELLLFDLDGVLADTASCHRRAYAELWRRMGVAGPSYASIAGLKTAEVVARVAAPLGAGAGQVRAWTRFKQMRARRHLATQAIVFGDVAACFARLSHSPALLALGTSASRATARLVLRRLDLASRFAAVVTAADVARGKPAPDIYCEAMRRLGVAAASTLVIEDSAAGLRAAIAARARAASVRSGERLEDPRFFGAFAGLEALLEAVEPHLP